MADVTSCDNTIYGKLAGQKNRVTNLNGSFTVWCHLCSKERCLSMPGITIFEQSKSKYKNTLSENAITKEQVSVQWGREGR